MKKEHLFFGLSVVLIICLVILLNSVNDYKSLNKSNIEKISFLEEQLTNIKNSTKHYNTLASNFLIDNSSKVEYIDAFPFCSQRLKLKYTKNNYNFTSCSMTRVEILDNRYAAVLDEAQDESKWVYASYSVYCYCEYEVKDNF